MLSERCDAFGSEETPTDGPERRQKRKCPLEDIEYLERSIAIGENLPGRSGECARGTERRRRVG